MLKRTKRRVKTLPKKVDGDVMVKPLANNQNSANSTTAPQWFSWACAEPCESIKVPISGAEDETILVHCLRWGKSKSKRGLVLIHGGGANAAWYRFIAPFFSSEFDVIAISNSGNGESGIRKTNYSLKKWGEEILICAESLGLFDEDRPQPYILAHSLGTYVTVNLLRGVDFPNARDKFGGVILADGAIRPYELSKIVHERVADLRASDPNLQPRAEWNINPPSLSPESRFKLRPYQDCHNGYIIKFLADTAREIVDEDGSWCWKGDCNRDGKVNWESMPILCDTDVLEIALHIPVTFMYGEDSVICDPSVADFVRTTHGRHIGVVGIPFAAHHIWLDQPLPFVAAVRGIFAGWPKDCEVGNIGGSEEEDFLRREALLESRL